MTYYQLNDNHNNIKPDDFFYVGSNEYKSEVFVSETLHKYLNNSKTEIDIHYNQWDQVKRITNPYEYIHTQIPNYKMPVSKYKPLSRSYFKFIELAHTFSLLSNFDSQRTLNSFHLAEGPGGFIEAIVNLRKNTNDKYYGMTLLNSDVNVPGWNKSQHFLSKNPNVVIEKGETGNGDLLHPNNVVDVYNKYGNSMNIITGDGGFDFSVDFNQQEKMSTKLIFAQICYALIMQKKGGHFILKFFDTFSRASVEMIYILNSFYENVYVVKPNTSRYANSERYVVCKNFKRTSTSEFVKLFMNIISDMQSNCYVDQILKNKVPYYFIVKIEEINAILGQQQLETIVNTLALIQNNNRDINNKIEQIITNNIQKCSVWCLKHNVNYNKMISIKNSFFDNDEPENKFYINKI